MNYEVMFGWSLSALPKIMTFYLPINNIPNIFNRRIPASPWKL